jgi:acyl carrier protein
MPDSIEQKVIALIAKSQGMPVEQIKLDTTFEEIGMTSLDSLALIFDLEEEFSISIANEDAMGLRNVRQAVESVSKLVVQNDESLSSSEG